jgi:FixJ family two-component response regulator
MRVARSIVLSEQTRRRLGQQSRGRSTQARVVLRSRIVLLAAEGLQNKQIAATLKVAPRMAALWRGRFDRAWDRRSDEGRAAARPHTVDIESFVD